MTQNERKTDGYIAKRDRMKVRYYIKEEKGEWKTM
jgi:hypothetical protein